MDFLYFLFFILLGSSVLFNNGLRVERILGGIVSRRTLFKYTVAVMYKLESGRDQNICAGAILNNHFIATVAHCFYDKLFGEWRTSLFYIAVGMNKLYEPHPMGRKILVDTVTIPRTYDPDKPDDHTTEGNLALVKINESLNLRPNHPSLARLLPRKHTFLNLDAIYFISAYGYHEVTVVQEEIYGIIYDVQKGFSDRQLRYAKVKLLNQTDCANILGDNIAQGNFCAKILRNDIRINQATGICKFDSGAPLAHSFYLDAIAINGFISCDEEEKPGVYLSLVKYYTFIKSVISGHNDRYMRILQHRIDDEDDESEIDCKTDTDEDIR